MTLAKAQRAPRRRIVKVFFVVLASWRDEEKIGQKIILAKAQRAPSVEVVLLNILSVRI